MENAAVAIEVENPYPLDDGWDPGPGSWLLSPLPMAILCFALAALAARLSRRHHECVGAGTALATGIAIIALLQEKADRLTDNAIALWPWLIAVTLLGTAGGFAARIAGRDVAADATYWRTNAGIAMRILAAILLGNAAMLLPAVAFVAGMNANVGTTLAWLLFLALAAGIATGGWIIGRMTPRYPVLCAAVAVVVPPTILAVAFDELHGGIDWLIALLALLSVPATVTAYIASSRSPNFRLQQETESDGYLADLLRLSGLGLVAAGMLSSLWWMS